MKDRTKEAYYKWLRREEDLPGVWFTIRAACPKCGYRWLDAIKGTLPPCPKCGNQHISFCYEPPPELTSLRGF